MQQPFLDSRANAANAASAANAAEAADANSANSAATAAELREAALARTTRRLNAVAWLALVLPALAFVAVAHWQYRQALDDARAGVASAADVAKEHALRLFSTNEMMLERMLDLMGDERPEALLERGVELHQRLVLMARALPQVQGMFINDSQARAIASSLVHPPPRHIDYSDRSWYRWHSRPGNPPLFLSESITSRISGEPAFDFSRRRILADGSYGGSVHVSLRPSYFNDFWAELAKANPALHVGLVRMQGDFVARWPEPMPAPPLPPGHEVLERLKGGVTAANIEGIAHDAGVERLRAVRRLDGYPAFVMASVDRADVLGPWARRMGVLALFVFPTAFGFAASAMLALRRKRDEMEALRRLDEEAERRRRAELALMHSQKLEAMGRLTGGVAHDFNNVLSIVASNAELLRRLHPALADSQPLAGIVRAVNSGAKLTRQLLAFARKQALVIERVAPAERLPGLLDLIRPLVGSGVELTGRAEPDAGVIEVDSAELELALVNLAVNATDAMQRRGRLVIEVRPARPEEVRVRLPGKCTADGACPPYVLIDVDDDGPGIPAEVAERVFEPFYTSKPAGSGTGLGLAQVRNLCRGADGDAFVLKSPLGGARIRLLLAAKAGAAADASAGEAAPAAAAEQRLVGRRILLVEDNGEVAASTRALLEALGCRVRRLASADEALLAIEGSSGADRGSGGLSDVPDAVLSDVQMPGAIDGIELADRLGARRPAVPVVLMTGYANRIEQARAHGHDVLPKPCSAQVLADALVRALQRGRAVADA